MVSFAPAVYTTGSPSAPEDRIPSVIACRPAVRSVPPGRPAIPPVGAGRSGSLGRGGRAAMLQEPLEQRGIVVGPGPRVVLGIGIDREAHARPEALERRNHDLGVIERDDPVP